MRLPEIAIRNSSFVWMLVIFLTILGLRSLLNMPRTENPEVTVPGSSIVVILPGASALDMENMVALPVEEALNELEDIHTIFSDVRDGIAIVAVEFEFNTDADEKYDEVVQQVNGIRNDLPDEIVQLDMWQWSISDMNMLQLALVSATTPFRELEQIAEDLKSRVEKLRDIRKVEFYGLPDQEIHVHLDFEKMAMVNTSMDMVIRAIETNNVNIPGGEIKLGPVSMSVKSSGSFENLEQIRNCVVNAYEGRLIYLRDLAEVEFGYGDRNHITRYGSKSMQGDEYAGHRSVFIGISQKQGLNVLHTAREVMPVIESFREGLPEGIGLEVIYDQSSTVRDRINQFLGNLLQGLVMVENIDRFMRMGHGRREASVLAASEIGWPVIAATVTTVLAFVPIAVMPKETGAFIKSLPVTIMITLSVSLFIALTFTPVITSRIFRRSSSGVDRSQPVGRLLGWIIAHPFRSTMRLALKNPWITLGVALLYLGGSSYMFRYVGISFFPKAEQPNLMVQASLPEGYNLDRTDEVARYIESVLDTMPEVRYFATNVGQGNPQIYYNVFPRRNDARFAEVYVQLYEYEPENFAHTIGKMRRTFSMYPGARIRVREFEQGPPFEAPVQIFLSGDDLEVLREISADVEQMIRDQPGTINIENQFVKTNPELLFGINREKANMMGVPLIEVDRTIRTAVTGMEISRLRDGSGEEYGIVVGMNHQVAGHDAEFRIEDLDRVYVSSVTGRQIPIRQFVDLTIRQVPSSVSRNDLERTAEILSDLQPGFTLDEVLGPVLEKLDAYQMPEGYSYRVSGEMESRQDSFGGMANAVLIAVISIFSILVLQFRSVRQPLIIFIAVPFAFTGMVWALLITGNTFSFTAFVGLTSLVGIVVNNSIILVDYINVLRKRGETLDSALVTAAETRLIPIVLTALTTVGGLLPLTLQGGTMWAPMGWTIIGGLLVSTVLTLIVVPVTYYLMERRGIDNAGSKS